MYKRVLNITIFSDNSYIEDSIKSAAPLENFLYNIKTLTEIPDYKSDIIIHDIPGIPHAENALNVYCCEAVKADDYITTADDIWIKPFSGKLLRFYFERLANRIKMDEDLYLANNVLETIINSVPDLIWLKDLHGAHLNVNDSFCKAVQKTKADIIGRGHYYIWDMPKEEYDQGEYVCLESEEVVIRERKTCQFDEPVKTKYGMRQFKTYKSPVFDKDNTVIGTVGIAHDVTNLNNVTAEMNILIQSMPFAIIITDLNHTIIDLNKNFEEYFHCSKNDLINKNICEWAKTVSSDFSHTRKVNGHFRSDYKQSVIIEAITEPIFDMFNNRTGTLSIFHDVTAESNIEKQMFKNAVTDFLTGLYNRRYLFEYTDAHRNNDQISMMYIDLDNFKHINDTYGHAYGDKTLQHVANIIKTAFPNDICTRLGGDEFVITFIGSHSTDYLREKADILLNLISAECDDGVEALTASIGIAYTANPKISLEKLLQAADSALYTAKDNGKAQCFIVEQL